MNVRLYTPHDNQRLIHDSINNEPFKYYVLNIGRQWGKSLMAMNQIYFWAFNNKKVQIAWVSPIYKQAEKVFDEMVRAFAGTNSIKSNGQKLLIETPNGSTIQFFSAERYDNIRGFTFDYLVCDEFAFMAEQAWTEVLRATVLVKGKKVLLISTPKGKNHFHNLFNLDGINSQYKSYKMTSYDNPIIEPLEIDGARLTLPENVFRQEYLAEFIDGGAGVFKEITVNESPSGSSRYYAGIDLGRADDYTVLTILNERGQMVYCDRWRHNSWKFIIDQMLPHLKKWSAKCYMEVNSVGDAVYEQMKPLYRDLEPFQTTTKSKQDIIEALQVAIQNKEFTSLNVDWLLKEFELFTYEYSPASRSIRYSAPVGFHDDGVMSCAIAYHALKTLKHSGKYSFM